MIQKYFSHKFRRFLIYQWLDFLFSQQIKFNYEIDEMFIAGVDVSLLWVRKNKIKFIFVPGCIKELKISEDLRLRFEWSYRSDECKRERTLEIAGWVVSYKWIESFSETGRRPWRGTSARRWFASRPSPLAAICTWAPTSWSAFCTCRCHTRGIRTWRRPTLPGKSRRCNDPIRRRRAGLCGWKSQPHERLSSRLAPLLWAIWPSPSGQRPRSAFRLRVCVNCISTFPARISSLVETSFYKIFN